MPDSQHDVTDSAQPDGANKRDSLMDLAEPDDAFLLASEQEDSLAAPRRFCALLVAGVSAGYRNGKVLKHCNSAAFEVRPAIIRPCSGRVAEGSGGEICAPM